MTETRFALTRRDLVRTGAGLALGTMAGMAWADKSSRAPRPATVTIVRDDQVLDENRRVRPAVLAAMLAETVTRVTG